MRKAYPILLTEIRYLILSLFLLNGLLAGCTKGRGMLPEDIGRTFEFKETVVVDGITMGSIYSNRNFNAFTDLIHYRNKWMIIFREGTAHAGGINGRVKLVSSTDGRVWTVEKIYAYNGMDLRDPKFLLDSTNNELFITCFGLRYVNGNKVSSNYAIKYDERQGGRIVLPIRIDREDDYNYVLWRYTHLRPTNYSMAYAFDSNNSDTSHKLFLFRSENMDKFETVTALRLQGRPSECTIKFRGKRMYLAVRAEYMRTYLGYSEPPYTEFTWLRNQDIPSLAAPDFLFYNSTLLIAGRDLTDKRFKFFIYDLDTEKVKSSFTFPGGYEVGYSGMCYNPQNKDELWISYYSIEEGHGSNIYLAKIDLNVWK